MSFPFDKSDSRHYPRRQKKGLLPLLIAALVVFGLLWFHYASPAQGAASVGAKLADCPGKKSWTSSRGAYIRCIMRHPGTFAVSGKSPILGNTVGWQLRCDGRTYPKAQFIEGKHWVITAQPLALSKEGREAWQIMRASNVCSLTAWALWRKNPGTIPINSFVISLWWNQRLFTS